MKRLLLFGVSVLLALATLVFAQASGQATFRSATGEFPFTYIEQSGHTYVSAEQVAAGLGGTLTPDANGFRLSLGESVAAFGSDSRFGVIREDLIEMPVPPIMVEGKPYVPWQFFHGLLSRLSSLDVQWDAASRTLSASPMTRDAVGVQVSVAHVQGISKIVLTLSAPAEYTVVREGDVFVIRFRAPLRPAFTEQAYEDPHIAKLTFTGSELRVSLTTPDVAGDAYQLENPPRVVLDLRRAARPVQGTPVPPSAPRRPQELPGIRTIVIDPGHGGKEVGAVGPGGLLEKDVTLTVARKLAASLSAKTGARIVLTRDDDSLVSLDQRTAIANQYKADLFLSIHMNAAVVKGARGSETYFLSLEASDELARKAAETENASAAADPESDLKLILWDLAQQSYLEESSQFAQAIQEEMNAASSIANRGVKQAPFKVLIGATMPAALVELGFISNPEEEARLQTAEFQDVMVAAMTRAVQRYKVAYETRIGMIQPEATATSPPAPAAAPATTTASPVPAQTRTEK